MGSRGEMTQRWRKVLIAGVFVLGLATAVPAQGADGTLVAQYEAATFSLSGANGAQYFRKSGNDPRYTSRGALLMMFGTGATPQTASVTANVPTAADRIVVPVRGEQCRNPKNPTANPWPHFTVAVDG